MKTMLIGARASGKSTVGRALAKLLHLPFRDLDDAVLARFDESTVDAVWSAHGEPAWRAAEVAALAAEIAAPGDAVIALGGGTPCLDDARPLLEEAVRQQQVRLVYLRYSDTILARRLRRRAGDRPSLTGKPVEEEVREVLAMRDPVYRAVAQLVLELDGSLPARAVARDLSVQLNEPMA